MQRLLRLGLVLPLVAGCGNLLGYDDVTFNDGGNAGGATSGGGTSSGGTANGGTSSGGTSNGGTSNGGTSNGGTSNGGTSNGGTSNGGTSSGGASSGGTSNGGTSSGGSGGSATGGTSNGGTSGGGGLETYRQKCVDQINAYRATLGLSAYQRWNSAETCVDGEAKADSESGVPHSAFGACGEWAQNECPGYGSLDSTVTTCLAQMWAEGPGADFQAHGHYINMSSTSYSQVACGFYVTPSGSVWAVQDFQ